VSVFYNDNDPAVAAWLRELVRAGQLPDGVVNEQPIQNLDAKAFRAADQCHFFAGIGGWPYALQLAGWGDRPVWTGSSPCQPFSVAGKRRGAEDDRHLWPAWFKLIRECRPVTVIGEQVESAIGHGWLDGVCADLEGAGYTVGAAVLGAHSVGAPHRRQRLYWVANLPSARREGRGPARESGRGGELFAQSGAGMADAALRGQRTDGAAPWRDRHVAQRDASRGMADAAGRRCPQRHAHIGPAPVPDPRNPWCDAVWLPCHDGKARRAPNPSAGVRIVAHGIPNRVGALRGAGNAIVPQVAAEFVRVVMDILGMVPGCEHGKGAGHGEQVQAVESGAD
jgi:DNA (cytosine-5)-methyltransferase 1